MSNWQQDEEEIINASSSNSDTEGSGGGISLPIPALSSTPQSPLNRNPASKTPVASPSLQKQPVRLPASQQASAPTSYESEVAKILLAQEVVKSVFRYDLHLTSLINLYMNHESERQLIFDASVVKVHGESIIPFTSAAEEKSASLRFERLLGTANRMYEVELTSFKNKNKELRAEWQVKFSKIVEDCRAKEERRETELLNAKAFCRREVDATIQRMKSTYADIDSANTAAKDLRETAEFLQGECKRLRETLSEARRQAEEDRTRHFSEREKIIGEYSTTLKVERERMAEKLKQLHETLEAERASHFKEMASKTQIQSTSGASLQSELSQAIQRSEYLAGELSTSRGELSAERKQFSEERLSLSRYIEELEVAIIEMGGKPENIKSYRSAQLYLDSTKARSASLKQPPAYSTAATSASPISARGAASFEHLSPIPKSQSIVDAMLGSRVTRHAGNPSLRPASLYSPEEEMVRNEAANKVGVLHSIRRSPSAELGLGYNSPYMRSLSRSMPTAAESPTHRVEAPFRAANLSPRSLGAAERARTLNNRGGTVEPAKQRSWH